MAEMKQSTSVQPTLSAPEANGSNDVRPDIVQLFQVPERFMRSVHLERDFDDSQFLSRYVLTPPMQALLSRIVGGVQPGSAHRAWRITGDYGTGKSSFALMLARLLHDPTSPSIELIREAVEEEGRASLFDGVRMLPILVTGAREPLVPSVARALRRSLERLRGRRRKTRVLEDLEAQADAVILSADHSQLLDLLEQVGCYSTKRGWSGVFLVLDELGKFLEYAALRPDKEDLYILQRLAEGAARDRGFALVVLGLLHQGFHAYAESLPSTMRQEWEKVAGRYGEITFDQPLSHVTALVSQALNINETLVPRDVDKAVHAVHAATLRTGWYGSPEWTPSALDLYPLHPTVLPVLVRFFARFGQHERSLFSFLLSSEPFGLQSFAARPANGHTWYRLPDFYDYIRGTFGYQLSASSYRGHWLRIVETIDGMSDVDDLQLRVLKAVAVLNVLDADHLLPTDTVLAAALAGGDESRAVSRAVESLKHRGLLFNRGTSGGYRLWPSTSVDLVSAFETAKRAVGSSDRLVARVRPYLGQSSVVARRHYIERGTLRHFEIRYADSATLQETIERSTEADGLVVVVLCDSPDEHLAIRNMVSTVDGAAHRQVVLAVPPPLRGVAAELLDAQCWQWVADNTPELNHDAYAASEVARQVSASRRALLRTLDSLLGFRGGDADDVEWWHCGRLVELPLRGKLSALLSGISDEVYCDAPRIHNELLNRRALSSAASAARLRLVERMFTSADAPSLGIDQGKAPPEKSMYLSVLSAGKVHREEMGQLVLAEPPQDEDPLHLRPALTQIIVLLEQANGSRVAVTEILDVLQSPPYGVRAGVAPLLLAITMVAHAYEIAMYENGTFLQQFNAHDFLRLTKQPSAFEAQLCRVAGVRMEVFRLLTRVFADEHSNDREYELLDVVRPLSVFAAQLPEYTRRNTSLQEPAKSVLNALLTAREPATLVFEALPVACGLDPFLIDGSVNEGRGYLFVDVLKAAVDALQSDYPRLLESIRDKVAVGVGAGGSQLHRSQIARRASMVMLAAREPRLQTFARSLADSGLSDDSWAERIGSVIVSKPPSRWTVTDRARAMDEIDLLVDTFNRTEATAFGRGVDIPDLNALRITLTTADGNETAQIVRVLSEDEGSVQELAEQLRATLNDSGRPDLWLAAMTRMLKNDLLKDLYPLNDSQGSV